MRIEVINSKLGKSEAINDILNIEEEFDIRNRRVLTVFQDSVALTLSDISEKFGFPIEKISVYDDTKDNGEVLVIDYTNYHSLFTANVSLGKNNGVSNRYTVFKFI